MNLDTGNLLKSKMSPVNYTTRDFSLINHYKNKLLNKKMNKAQNTINLIQNKDEQKSNKQEKSGLCRLEVNKIKFNKKTK